MLMFHQVAGERIATSDGHEKVASPLMPVSAESVAASIFLDGGVGKLNSRRKRAQNVRGEHERELTLTEAIREAVGDEAMTQQWDEIADLREERATVKSCKISEWEDEAIDLEQTMTFLSFLPIQLDDVRSCVGRVPEERMDEFIVVLARRAAVHVGVSKASVESWDEALRSFAEGVRDSMICGDEALKSFGECLRDGINWRALERLEDEILMKLIPPEAKAVCTGCRDKWDVDGETHNSEPVVGGICWRRNPKGQYEVREA